jgi:outer membrane receptor protein involved in Fe transport
LLNPTNQDQFADVSSSPLISLIGASEDFLNDYRFTALNGNVISGSTVISNSWTASSVLEFLSTFNPNDLVPISSDFAQPEKVTAWELGYKGFLEPHLFLDLNAYYNIYQDFLLPTTVMTPATGSVYDGTALAEFGLTNAGIFTYLRNNPNRLYSYGINLNANYSFHRGFYLGGNYSWEDFDRGNTPEELVPGFRKPPHRFNIYFGNRNLTEKLSFRINYRWYDSFLWPISFLAQDYTDSYGVVDMQFSYRIPSIKSILRIGANNIFRNEYSAIIRSSAVGATYYVSLTFDELLN